MSKPAGYLALIFFVAVSQLVKDLTFAGAAFPKL